MSRAKGTCSACLALLLLFVAGAAPVDAPKADEIPKAELAEVRVSDRLSTLDIDHDADGQPIFVTGDGYRLSAGEFADALSAKKRTRHWWQSVFDVTAPASLIMVGLGLFGQVLFTGRMVVQWLVSEKNKRSTVPPVFWWMSIAGATLLLIYFTWRRDIVGVLGQGTGWGIYARNLWLIQRRPATPKT